MRFLYATAFVCILGFSAAHAAPVPQNPTLAEWLAKGAIPKYQNGVFTGLLTNKDIEKTAHDTAAALEKKNNFMSGRGKPQFDSLKWKHDELEREKDIPVVDTVAEKAAWNAGIGERMARCELFLTSFVHEQGCSLTISGPALRSLKAYFQCRVSAVSPSYSLNFDRQVEGVRRCLAVIHRFCSVPMVRYCAASGTR
jgi:hypothetical protein